MWPVFELQPRFRELVLFLPPATLERRHYQLYITSLVLLFAPGGIRAVRGPLCLSPVSSRRSKVGDAADVGEGWVVEKWGSSKFEKEKKLEGKLAAPHCGSRPIAFYDGAYCVVGNMKRVLFREAANRF